MPGPSFTDPLAGLSEKDKYGMKGLVVRYHGSDMHKEFSRGHDLSQLGLDYESEG